MSKTMSNTRRSIILIFSLHLLQRSAAVQKFIFNTLTFKSLPSDVLPFDSVKARSFIFCSILCAKSTLCKSAFATEDTESLYCYLLDQKIPHENFEPGQGTYIYPLLLRPEEDPPPFLGGTFREIAEYNDMLIALFDFPATNLKTIGLVYDTATQEWPHVSERCANKLKDLEGFTSTVVSITEDVPGTTYRLSAHCQKDETRWDDAICSDHTGWHVAGDVGVGCVSSNCYRVNALGFSRYSGNLTVDKDGETCKPWVNSPEEDVSFPLDGYSRLNAGSYCRDPSGVGKPFCRFSPFWGACDVPLCENITIGSPELIYKLLSY